MREEMTETEIAHITTVLNATHAELIRSQDPRLASAPELALYRRATSHYDRGFVLAELGEAGMLANPETRSISLNTTSLDAVLKRRELITEEDRDIAATLFALHETFHIAQGIRDHAHVRRMKQIAGQWIISFLDLQSTSYAANLLADLLGLNTLPHANGPSRSEIFQRLWIDLGHASLQSFPIYNNPAKCQLWVGRLMMSALLLNPSLWPGWSTRDVLWPVWSINEDEIAVLSNNIEVIVPPTKVSRATLRVAVEHLCAGDVAKAFVHVCNLVDYLKPQRH
jgi:hypothetical protein